MAGLLTRIGDGLVNALSGLGTTADKSRAAYYHFAAIDQQQAEAAYRTSWLVRKIVDVPPFDMTRAWREWQAEKAQIEIIEALERRLALRHRVTRALKLARLFGGGALIMGVKQGEPGEPLDVARLGKDCLSYVHVVSRHQLTLGPCIGDPASPLFGQPSYFEMRSSGSAPVRIHPSRVIAFVGQPVPEGSQVAANDSWFWGDPIMQSIGDAVKNADLAQAGFATLINEASVDIIHVPDLMSRIASAEYEAGFAKRMTAANIGKSTHRALIVDKEEEWEQRQVNWTGMPDMLTAYLNIVAGAADIPVTRLLGQSPKGLQSTGSGEERDYNTMIMAQQKDLLGPRLDVLDQVLLRSALGSRPAEIGYTFAPISHTDPKTDAEIGKLEGEEEQLAVTNGLVPLEALAIATQNRMIESGRWPGLDAALKDVKAAEAVAPPADEEDDPSNVVPIRRAANDAAPRTLYVSRKVVNAAELIEWAKGQGFATTLPADELHVTITYSRAAVDWMAMGDNWSDDGKGNMTVPAGGARIVEPLGDKGAVVLLFASSQLSWRHEDMKRNGASFDFPQYQPHITVSYEAGDLDLSKVEPFRGKITLGPEIFEEITPDRETSVTEA